MPGPNCYDLFEAATRRLLGVDRIDGPLEHSLNEAYKYLCSAFHKSEPVSYGNELVRAAYMLTFAPRYAIYWQCFYRLNEFLWGFARLRTPASGVLKFNCIGLGPGSEVVGIATSGIPGLTRIDLNVIDCEPEWLEALESCLVALEAEAGITAPNLFHYPSLANAERGWPVIGSFVLSDIARQGSLEAFMAELANRTKGQPAAFMDTYAYLDADRGEQLIEHNLGLKPWTVNLHSECGLQLALNEQFSSSRRLSFQKPQADPKVAVFKVRFR